MRLSAVVAAAAAVMLAACTSSTSGTPTDSGLPSAGGSSSTAAPSPSPAAPTSAAKARAALLTTAEVGPGFVKQPFPGGSATESTSPCLPKGTPSLDAEYPPAARAETGFRSTATQALMGEEVALYRSAATAQQVIAYVRRALSCSDATVSGQTVHVRALPPTRQVRGQPVDYAQTWALKVGPAVGAIVAVRLGNAVVSLDFLALSSRDVNKLPAQDALAAAAVKRAKAALG